MAKETTYASAAIAAAVAAAAEIVRTSGGVYMMSESNAAAPEETSLVRSTPMLLDPASSTKKEKSAKPPSPSFNTLTTETSVGTSSFKDKHEDAEKRLAKSRERNREHARKTRLRKKAHLESLQLKVKKLQEERLSLKQSTEECSIASILMGLASGSRPQEGLEDVVSSTLQATSEEEQARLMSTTDNLLQASTGKRKRFDVPLDNKEPHRLTIQIEGETKEIGGGGTNVNWKTGVYCDENGVQRQLTQDQLETLRRERNRRHAKMTRDRKKCFISTVEKTIQQLEEENERMRDVLEKVKTAAASSTPTPSASVTPRLSPEQSPRFTAAGGGVPLDDAFRLAMVG